MYPRKKDSGMKLFSAPTPSVCAVFLQLLIMVFSPAGAAGTLDEVKTRGFLLCGITEASPGFSVVDEDGVRQGFDIDHCKTVAAAIFGSPKVNYIPLTPNTAFTTLQSGGVDLFTGGATWSFTRDASLGLNFTGIHYIGGQGFLVHKKHGTKKVADLDGATICVAQGTTNEQNLADYFLEKGLAYKSLTFGDINQGLLAYRMGRCDAITTNRAGLATRAIAFPDREDHLILEGMISKEPQSAVVRHGDDQWRDIVFWTYNVHIAAEELGINQENLDVMRESSSNLEVQRLLGVTGNFGERLGLPNDWAYSIIQQVGNYNDMWQRNFTPLGLDRGVNRLWTDGGLMYALPIR